MKTIYTEPFEIGGHTVETDLHEGYDGPCGVYDTQDRLICAFPNVREAMRSAGYASTPDGGYGSVYVSACQHDDVTHDVFEDWM